MTSVESDGEVSAVVDPGNMHTVDNDDTPALATSVDPDEQARDFSQKSWREDLELVVEGRTLHVASTILSLLSPVFTAMFEERFQGAGPRRLQLPDKKHGDVVQFLRCLYPNICQQITEDNVFVVLPLAEEFKVKQLKKACEDFLVQVTKTPLSAENICKYLQLAFRYDLAVLKAKCFKLAGRVDCESLSEAERVYPLSLDVKVELQAKQLDKSKNSMSKLLLDKHNTDENNDILTEYLIYDWTVSKGKEKFRQAALGTLKLTVSDVSTFRSSASRDTIVHGLRWQIHASRKESEDTGDQLAVFLSCKAPDDWHKWECETVIKIWLLNKETGKHCIRHFLQTFSSSSSKSYGYPKFISLEDLITDKYAVDDTFEINAYFMVIEPTCKPNPKELNESTDENDDDTDLSQ